MSAVKKRQPPVWINGPKWVEDENQTFIFQPGNYKDGVFILDESITVEYRGKYADAIKHLCEVVRRDKPGYDEWRLSRKITNEKRELCYYTGGKPWR